LSQVKRTKSSLWFRRGIGDGMHEEEGRGNTGSPFTWSAQDQPDAREGQAGRVGVAERPVVPLKSGNADGGKGPLFKTNARSGKG
jgi:hypothetical protein